MEEGEGWRRGEEVAVEVKRIRALRGEGKRAKERRERREKKKLA